jgi:hypothetical protein
MMSTRLSGGLSVLAVIAAAEPRLYGLVLLIRHHWPGAIIRRHRQGRQLDDGSQAPQEKS